jgi:hypothetical protein
MKAILINPIDETITEVNYNGDYKQIYQFIDASMFGVVDIPNDDSIYIDDEGLFKDNQYFFTHNAIPTLLGGKGLVLGIDHKTGNSTDANSTILEIRKNITFMGKHIVDQSKIGFTIIPLN